VQYSLCHKGGKAYIAPTLYASLKLMNPIPRTKKKRGNPKLVVWNCHKSYSNQIPQALKHTTTTTTTKPFTPEQIGVG
jgi:hypothetical protein